MKTLSKIISALALCSAISFSSCNSDDDVPRVGTGDGKLGIAMVLRNNRLNSANSRIENSRMTVERGFIQIKELELEIEGKNERGHFEKEIEIEFDEIKRIDFNQFDKSVDFFINIPEGEYKKIELTLDLIDHRNQPSISFEGRFESNSGSSIPFRFEHFGDDIDFEVEIEADDDNYFTVDRRKNPLALFQLNAINWLRNVTNSEMENANRTNGVIVLNRNSNSNIYNKIRKNIEESSEIEVDLD